MTSKICRICHQKIYEDTQDYVKIEGFHKGKKSGPTLFYHRNCYMDMISTKQQTKALIGMAQNLGMRANSLIKEGGY